MAAASIANFDISVINNSVFVIINNLMKQHKPENLDNIYKKLMKTIEYQSKKHPSKRS